jgi:hypothetical protein
LKVKEFGKSKDNAETAEDTEFGEFAEKRDGNTPPGSG